MIAAIFGFAITVALVCISTRTWCARSIVRRRFSPRRSVVRPRRRLLQPKVTNELPLLIDMVRLGVASGLNAFLALKTAQTVVRGGVADEVQVVLQACGRGQRLVDALALLVERNAGIAPLATAIISAERYGAALTDALQRLADELRADRMRDAERAARRLSVFLVVPVAVCVLPAFALLTVAPLLAGSSAWLALPFS